MKENKEVQKRMQLPEAVYRLLAAEGIKKEDILHKAEPDLDAELRFTRNYLVMTKEWLVLICYPYQPNGKFRFGGYAGNELATGAGNTAPEIKKFTLEEIESLEVIRAVSGGSLMAKGKETETFLCAFSNSRMGEVERAKRNLGKIKKSEELSDEDILGRNKQECCPKCGTMYPDQSRKICPRCMDKKIVDNVAQMVDS